jgi:hemolysin III
MTTAPLSKKSPKKKSFFSSVRDPISGITHLCGAIFFAVGLIAMLIAGQGNLAQEISLAVYGAGLILLFSASAAYHLYNGDAKRLLVLRKFDHSSIYVLIAASYTPLCVIAFRGFWQWGLLAIIWALALAGIVVKIFVIKGPRWLTAGIYLVMGWLSLIALGEMMATLSTSSIVWLFAGGVVYSLGAVIYITKKLNFKPGVFGFHEVWHIFVLLGALCHFISIWEIII